MAEQKPDNEQSLVEKWLAEQQQWQRTLQTYLDSMVKNPEFLVHLGNAMRGSLLAGKPYPTATPGAAMTEDPSDDRLDRILFALHELEGQVRDLRFAVDELRAGAKKKGKKHKSGKRKDDE